MLTLAYFKQPNRVATSGIVIVYSPYQNTLSTVYRAYNPRCDYVIHMKYILVIKVLRTQQAL
jgi:hypothetical protein